MRREGSIRVAQTGHRRAAQDDKRLFISVADGISHALLQISCLSESAVTGRNVRAQDWQAVHDISQASLQLLRGYNLTLRLQQGMQQPVLVPLATSAILHETARLLEPYARQLGVDLELDVSSRLEPVLVDRVVLQTALLNLGQVFVSAHSETERPVPVRLAAHKTRYGIVVGLYGEGIEVNNAMLRRARHLYGRAFQPYTKLVSGPASGVFVADGLLSSVSAKLHAARYRNATGLAVTLPICRQMRLV